MFRYLKLTDTHLRHDNLDHKIPALTWVAQQAIERQVDAVLHAGDLVDHDSFGGKLSTPGGVVEAYFNAFAKPLEDAKIPVLIARGNHDKRGANRGSALWNFMGVGSTEIFETVGRHQFARDGKAYNVIVCPWLYPEELVGGYKEELYDTYIDRVVEMITGQLYPDPYTPEANILVAHCRYAGASMSSTKVAPSREGMVLPRELLVRFDDLHLGDIHLRQPILENRGGFTGALTQEGLDEAGNPCGVEIVTINDSGICHEWVDYLEARRYELCFVETIEEAQEQLQDLPPSNFRRTTRFKSDGSPLAKAIATVLEPLARLGVKIEPQFASRERIEVEADTTKLDDPSAALDLYAKSSAMEVPQLTELHVELDDLMSGSTLSLPDHLL